MTADDTNGPRAGDDDAARSRAGGTPAHAGASSLAGRTIANYHILRELGRGGMGVVYEAEQQNPRRRVALKVIHPGLSSSQALRRFEHETQVLGRLQHAGIAQIYEAGTFDAGHGAQPFFAMEFIEGEPLTQYAERRDLGTRERLALIAKVSHAVAHAHQKGVIHRDLKPANILVVDVQGTGEARQSSTGATTAQPKVLDFGVARATDSDVQAATLQTDIGQLVGTLPYMSPEQAGGDPGELDTRSDVYALGVLAYELLAGRLPYDLRQKMIHEAVRVIREVEPTRLSSIDRALRGDVEILVGKALAKEKQLRYQTASDFASDIERYLRDEPIVARPPSAAYQLRKFARRNKALVAGLAATFLALVGGLIGTGHGLAKATAAQAREEGQRRLAEANEQRALEAAGEAEREAARARSAEAEAKQRAEELDLVARFQSSQLADIQAERMGSRLREDIVAKRRAYVESRGGDEAASAAAARELQESLTGVNFTSVALGSLDENILDRALRAIDERFGDQPLVKARLLGTVADTMQELGLLQRATAPLAEEVAIRRRELGDDHPQTLRSIHSMGVLLQKQGRLTEAEPLQAEALAGYRRELGDENSHTLNAIATFGGLLTSQGRPAEAEALWREVVATQRRVLGDEHESTLSARNNLGMLLLDMGKHDEAESILREVLETRRRVQGSEHPETLVAVNNLGNLLARRGKFADAEPYTREGLELCRRVLGDDHPETIAAINNMASLLDDQGKLAEAEPYWREALATSQRVLGDEHATTLTLRNNMGFLLRAQGRLTEAEPYWREVLEARRRRFGDEHRDTLNSIGNLGALLLELGKVDEAEPYYQEALATSRRVLGDDDPRTLDSINNMGILRNRQGRVAEAEALYREALAGSRRMLGDLHPSTLSAVGNLGATLYKQGKLAEAEPCYREALEIRRRTLGDDHPKTLTSIRSLAALLGFQGKFAEAEPYRREALERSRRALGDEHATTRLVLRELGQLLVDLRKWDEAEALCLECYQRNEQQFGPDHENTVAAVRLLVDLHDAWHTAEPNGGHAAKAAAWRAELPTATQGR